MSRVCSGIMSLRAIWHVQLVAYGDAVDVLEEISTVVRVTIGCRSKINEVQSASTQLPQGKRWIPRRVRWHGKSATFVAATTSAYGPIMIQLAFKRQADVTECQLTVKFRSEVRILEVLYKDHSMNQVRLFVCSQPGCL